MLSPEQREIASAVLKNLQSEKYKGKNELFLRPFDLSQVPGYLDVVRKPMDLQTVSQNLQSGAYSTEAELWSDMASIFENAIKYHDPSKPTKWIAKFAKDMLKSMGKERKAAEKKVLGKPSGGGASIKLKIGKLPTAGGPGKQLPPAAVTSLGSQSESPSQPPAKKPKLKLSLPSKSKALDNASVTSSASTSTGKPKQPEKRKLKLKLSLSKAATTASSETTTQSTGNDTTTSPKAIEKPSTKTTPTSATKAKSPKISLKLGGQSRGKELPRGVVLGTQQPSSKPSQVTSSTTSKPAAPKPAAPKPAAPKSAAPKSAAPKSTAPKSAAPKPASSTSTVAKPKKTKVKKAAARKAAAPTATPLEVPSTSSGGMDLKSQKQCMKVISGLRRREHKQITWFLNPVSDKNILQHYKAKIKHPRDLSTVQAKLEKGSYGSIADFALDMRRIFSNCLRYNTSLKDSLRPVAVKVLQTTEDLMKVFLLQKEPGSYPSLLFCWKLCIEIMDTLYNLVNPTDGQPTAFFFLHPVSYFCGGQFPPDYLEKVKRPMDFGSVTGHLLEGRYTSADEFAADCRLVLTNCMAYYEGREDGKIYIEQATRLSEYLSRQLDQLARYQKSSKGAADRLAAQQTITLARPPSTLLVSIIEDLRGLKYTDKGTKITEAAMGPFEKPVSLADFVDYLQFVKEPMDLQAVERKAKAGNYETPEDFEYDMNLCFKNCEVYNSHRKSDHLVAMAKYASRQFRRVYYNKIRAFEDPSSVPPPKQLERKASLEESRSSSPASQNKKVKVEGSGVSKGKIAPRISITAAQVSSATTARAKSPKQLSGGTQQKKNGEPTAKPNQPIPLHIAIARVKEAFPLRRALKSLQPWENDCCRYYKELSRHPWLSAARPKFIFHVPVPTLFPELKEAYSAKIRTPMDLTTIECTLLAGNRYASPEDFCHDIALVFTNAIRFNKDGRDVGDPLSCAYYDASVHLLRYARWMSLELLAEYQDESEHVDEPGADGLPPIAWKLTAGNKKKAREEMEALVLKEPIEKSLEGDRWTWHEAECEKLLKALRHQSDLRHMTFFIQPNYPADYTAFISKPMDWEKVHRKLKKRQYDNFGDVIDDLRLIFTNALKYNARLKGTDTVSGRAYEAATIMSSKLEAAINKLMLSASDRLERERIDHANGERELEAMARAEEDEIRAAWKKEPEREGSAPAPSRTDVTQKVGSTVRRATYRKETTDFEIPFFDDEDNGQHERSYFEVIKVQRSMFEKQRQELLRMRQATLAVGGGLFAKLLQQDMAIEWAQQEVRKTETKQKPAKMQGDKNVSGIGGDETDTTSRQRGSSVQDELAREGRSHFRMSLATAKKGTKRKRAFLDLE